MSEPAARDRSRSAIVIALVLCVLSLGISWVGSVPGYRTDARVYVVAAIAFLAFALARHDSKPESATTALTGALISLGTVLALGLRDITTTALVVTVGTFVLLLSVRLQPRRT